MVDFHAAARKPKDPPALEPQIVEPEPPAVYDITVVKVQLKKHETQIEKLKTVALALVVNDPVSNVRAVEIASDANKLAKAIEEIRKKFNEPVLEYQRALNALAKNYKDPLEEIVRNLKGKTQQYQAKIDLENRKAQELARKAAEELQEKVNAEAKAAGVEAPVVETPIVAPVSMATRTEKGTMSFREVWKFEIADPAMVPRDYLMVDESAIRQAVKAGVRKIAGVEIFSVKEPILR